MTLIPSVLQYRVLRNIPMLTYRKVRGYPAYALSFLPTETIYKPYMPYTYETGLEEFPFVVILDNSSVSVSVVIDALKHKTPELYHIASMLPAWYTSAKRWLKVMHIDFVSMPCSKDTTDINELETDYIPFGYKTNKSRYVEVHISKDHITQIALSNAPYRVTETEYIVFLRTQVTRATVAVDDKELEKVYRCCEYKLHVHRRDLLHSITSTFKPEHTTEDKWLSINELLMKEEQWLTEHASWNNEALYNSMGGGRLNND